MKQNALRKHFALSVVRILQFLGSLWMERWKKMSLSIAIYNK